MALRAEPTRHLCPLTCSLACKLAFVLTRACAVPNLAALHATTNSVFSCSRLCTGPPTHVFFPVHSHFRSQG